MAEQSETFWVVGATRNAVTSASFELLEIGDLLRDHHGRASAGFADANALLEERKDEPTTSELEALDVPIVNQQAIAKKRFHAMALHRKTLVEKLDATRDGLRALAADAQTLLPENAMRQAYSDPSPRWPAAPAALSGLEGLELLDRLRVVGLVVEWTINSTADAAIVSLTAAHTIRVLLRSPSDESQRLRDALDAVEVVAREVLLHRLSPI